MIDNLNCDSLENKLLSISHKKYIGKRFDKPKHNFTFISFLQMLTKQL